MISCFFVEIGLDESIISRDKLIIKKYDNINSSRIENNTSKC